MSIGFVELDGDTVRARCSGAIAAVQKLRRTRLASLPPQTFWNKRWIADQRDYYTRVLGYLVVDDCRMLAAAADDSLADTVHVAVETWTRITRWADGRGTG